MEKDYDEIVEQLLGQPYWVVDLLPFQVPEEGGARFFAVERYYLQEPQHGRLCLRFADVLLNLNCYRDLLVNRALDDDWFKNPEPAALAAWIAEALQHGHLCILIDDGEALITASGGDTHLTLYNPSPELLELVRQLSAASGLFVWQPAG